MLTTYDMKHLSAHVELIKKSVFLIDEYSIISKTLLDGIYSALLKTTTRNCAMGGIRTSFFLVTSPSVLKGLSDSLRFSPIYKYSNRYNLVKYTRYELVLKIKG